MASGVSAAPLLRALLRLWLDLECFLDGPIFRPRRTFRRELFDLGLAQLLAQRGHEFVVTPLLGDLTLVTKFFELQIDVADESRSTVHVSKQRQEQRDMLQRDRNDDRELCLPCPA